MSKNCCDNVHLVEFQHPDYRCLNCGKRVRLVKIERIEAIVIDKPEIPTKPFCGAEHAAGEHSCKLWAGHTDPRHVDGLVSWLELR